MGNLTSMSSSRPRGSRNVKSGHPSPGDRRLLAIVDALAEARRGEHVLGHALAPLATGLRARQRIAQLRGGGVQLHAALGVLLELLDEGAVLAGLVTLQLGDEALHLVELRGDRSDALGEGVGPHAELARALLELGVEGRGGDLDGVVDRRGDHLFAVGGDGLGRGPPLEEDLTDRGLDRRRLLGVDELGQRRPLARGATRATSGRTHSEADERRRRGRSGGRWCSCGHCGQGV